jgi:hypothetical protein
MSDKYNNQNTFADLKINLIFGTHHKTGTIWMRSIAMAVADRCGFHFLRYPRSLKDPVKVLNQATQKNSSLLRIDEKSHIRSSDRDDATVVHLIRDPRDVLVSATFYHQKSTENFLLRPWRRATGTTTYQDHIKSFESFEAQATFEMSAYSAKVFADMNAWDYDKPNCIELKYEDLIVDRDMVLFRRVFEAAGLDASQTVEALEEVWNNSLFGVLAEVKLQKAVVEEGTHHIRSGKTSQWRKHFTPELAAAFHSKYQPLLERLGYETDGSWVDSV